ncbi:MAG: hypothetical protein HY699_17250 [Deltaproteobacteria bacterium]|nr:hypothetical protein [Deltaproteobacteria bacterium]
METNRGIVAGTLVALALVARSAAAEVTIDNFSSAVSTYYVTNTNVAQTVVGSTTVTDPGRAGVIGGVRQLTVEAQSLLNIPVPDYIVSGVEPIGTFLEYNSTVNGDGRIELLYDRGGVGLNAHLGRAFGILVAIINADASAPPYDVAITLTDNSANSATVTQTVPVPGGPLSLYFRFQDFVGVDANRLYSIQVVFDPNTAADLRIGRIETYGTAVAAPVLSGGASLLLIGGLLLVGLLALAPGGARLHPR